MNVVEERMLPLRIAMLVALPLHSMPLPLAALAMEAMVKPLRSRVTSLAEMTMPLPEATVRLAAR